MEKITFLVLAGRKNTDFEAAVQIYETKKAMVYDLIDKISHINLIDKIIISSNDGGFLNEAAAYSEKVTPHIFEPGDKFVFGEWLRSCITRFDLKKIFYWGSGASPFMTSEYIEKICNDICQGENILYTNNFFSADWTAFTPGKAALEIPPPPLDNNLANSLWKEKGLNSIYIAPSVEIAGDVDTPADLLSMSINPDTGKHTAEYLAGIDLPVEKYKLFSELLKGRNDIFLYGRVGSALFRYLDMRSSCRYRVISEERGMKSSGKLNTGGVRSYVGEMIEKTGMETFFRFIEETSAGAVIDTRVIFAHICKKVSPKDRFCSDLGLIDEITDPFVKEFTQRAFKSPIPILCGGHSLILGGLWSMVRAFGELPDRTI
ncbi:MAG: hypothetical protein LWY06_06145 [Firmicutes bacterium]|nr:hypothetical protein [Bacillota bacterium]